MHSCCNGVTNADLGSSGYCAELFQQEFFTRADGSLGWSAPGAYCFNGYLVEACIDTTATASRTTLSLGEVHLTRGKAGQTVVAASSGNTVLELPVSMLTLIQPSGSTSGLELQS